ncbi:NUDIX hydrolase [Natroniella sulfidigena]|uniref:NUDIX hydrolase n=1 Tax=Natroniella sulfidigena TaxID=723921 RepID=UPI00200AA38F|nr:NUDIX hydrolase [Natroniella sulfidigena]MCK8818050.1 NUDIX hydrolase [Natroniella sulfidigena]
MKKLWETIEVRTIYDRGFVKFKERSCRHKEKGIKYDFFKMEFLDWVTVVPITVEQEVILVKQYRIGTEEVTLEIPGGTLDPGEENSKLAAKRELLEETGYDSEKLVKLGKVAVNPAIQNNYCHFYLAQDVKLIGEQSLDKTEDIELKVVPLNKIQKLINSERINHSLSILPLLYTKDYLK